MGKPKAPRLLRHLTLLLAGCLLLPASGCALLDGPVIPPPWEATSTATPPPSADRDRLLTDISGSLHRSAQYLAQDPPGSVVIGPPSPPKLALDSHAPAWKLAEVPPGSNPTPVGRVPATAGKGYVIGSGDTVNIQVLGRTELTTTGNVSADGRVTVGLVGPTVVGGLTPAEAAQSIAKALRDGQFLVNPQVSVTFTEYQSQMVSILGEVRSPGRFPVRSRLSVLDALALAGGIVENGAPLAYVLRPEDATMTRYEINLDTLLQAGAGQSFFELLPGDSLVVPKSEQFFIYGEVRAPNGYRIRPGMSVIQALAMAGGLTDKGTDRRLQLRRRLPDGSLSSRDANLFDAVEPNDVIYVRERLF